MKDLNDQRIDRSPGDSSDQQSTHVVQQAIKDDEGLSAVADDIHVTVKDGAITLNGTVSNEQQMNLATNTATAVGVVDFINNYLVIRGGSLQKGRLKEHWGVMKTPSEERSKAAPRMKQWSPAGTDEFARADDDGFALPAGI